MKLLVLSHVSDFLGGAERSLLDIIDLWRTQDKDLEVEFIIRKPLGGIERELEKRGISYYSIDYTYWSDSNLPNTPDRIFGNALRNMKAVSAIEKVITDSNPDIVLTNSIIAPWAALAAHYTKKPHVWMVREYGERDHGRDFEIGERDTFEDIGNLSELVLTNSRTLSSFVSEFIDSKKVSTIYTPFDIENLCDRSNKEIESPYVAASDIKLALTGNIAPGKGHPLLIRSVGLLKEMGIYAEVCFIGREGSKEYMSEIYEIIDSLGVRDRIKFVGYQSNPLSFVKHADLAIMSSRMEAFGRVTFEYAAIGKPVVGSNSGATPELVVDNKTGMLYDPGSHRDLANKIEQYVTRPELLEEHGMAARAHAKSMMEGEFSARKIYAQLKDLVGVKKTVFGVLNYSRRWTNYPVDAQRYIEYINKGSLLGVVKSRAKTRLRPLYVRLSNLRRHLSSGSSNR